MDATAFCRALLDPSALSDALRADATLRVWRWDGAIATRGRQRVVGWLAADCQNWPDPSLEIIDAGAAAPANAVQFRIQATENGRYVEHNRALFLSLAGNQVQSIDLYCGEPVYSAHRKNYLAPATMTDAEVRSFLEESWHSLDAREWVPLDWLRHESLRVTFAGSGDAHPAGNFVGGTRWTEEEADARIDAILDAHRRNGAGCAWWIMPFDTPADLPQRLERRGLMFAGTNVRMARLGLDDLSDIPVNPELRIRDLEGGDDAGLDALVDIDGLCFHASAEQLASHRARLRERLNDPVLRQQGIYCLAYLRGEPVGMATANFRAGFTYLSGAATLPAYRGQRVYSTLLAHRLAAARERGYHLASIDAGPMSKRVVEKYGFKEYGTVRVYGWMPNMDPAVIRALVPDE